MSTSAAVKDVLVILASGIAILIGLVILVYVILLVFDRYCCCCPWFSPISELNPNHVLFSGRIGQEARLVGITSAERKQILDKILVSKTYAEFRASLPDNNDTNASDDAVTSDPKPNVSSTKEDEDEQGQIHHVPHYNESMCAICINDYEEEDIVTHGTSCVHVFHKECLLEWLDKHDVCPTCRKDMMTADEMKNAAKTVLSAERANEIASAWSNNVPLPGLDDPERGGNGENNDSANALEMTEISSGETSGNPTTEQPIEETAEIPETPQNEQNFQDEEVGQSTPVAAAN